MAIIIMEIGQITAVSAVKMKVVIAVAMTMFRTRAKASIEGVLTAA